MKSFQELEYVRPDLESFIRSSEARLEQFEQAADYEEAREILLDMQKAESSLSTLLTIAMVRNTIDTRDPFYEAEAEFLNEHLPTLIPLQIHLYQALLNSPYRDDLEQEFGRQLMVNAETALKTQDPAIMQDKAAEAKLSHDYQKLTAGCQTEFEGQTINFYGLLKHMEDRDRQRRQAASRAWAKLYEDNAPELDRLFDQLTAVRVNMAKTLGYESYTDLAYLDRGRTDYTSEDAARFRQQILDVVVPFCTELRQHQAQRLGIDRVRYYDEPLLFPEGNPQPAADKHQMVRLAQTMYHEMSPESAEFFNFMVEYNLFDLDTKPGKRMGGYCTSLSDWKAPFIFSNFNGTSADVDVLTHEAGHSFAYYTASRKQPLNEYEFSTSEINEIHSMTMEHFAYPWMDQFFGDQADRYRYLHLSQALLHLPYMVCVDEFQHEVYAHPDMGAQGRRDIWHKLEKRYMPWRDYDGIDFLEQGGFWMQKQHIFQSPFYYIEYALAQMGAFEFYGRMKENRGGAWQDYLTLCRAGGSLSYVELLKAAGLSNPFENGSVAKATAHVIDELRQHPLH